MPYFWVSQTFHLVFNESTKVVKILVTLRLIMVLYQKQLTLMFLKIGVLKDFAIFAGKHLCWSFFSIRFQALGLRPATLLKKDTNTRFSCEYRTPPVAAFLLLVLCIWTLSFTLIIYQSAIFSEGNLRSGKTI